MAVGAGESRCNSSRGQGVTASAANKTIAGKHASLLLSQSAHWQSSTSISRVNATAEQVQNKQHQQKAAAGAAEVTLVVAVAMPPATDQEKQANARSTSHMLPLLMGLFSWGIPDDPMNTCSISKSAHPLSYHALTAEPTGSNIPLSAVNQGKFV